MTVDAVPGAGRAVPQVGGADDVEVKLGDVAGQAFAATLIDLGGYFVEGGEPKRKCSTKLS